MRAAVVLVTLVIVMEGGERGAVRRCECVHVNVLYIIHPLKICSMQIPFHT